jgi:predicted ATPase/class 3 adenylate cyclase
MQCPQCNTELPDQAKFCFECGAKLSLACPQCGMELPAQAKFCFECGAKIGAPPPAAGPERPVLSEAERMAARLERLVPKEFAERLLEARGKTQGERRMVTILFSDVKGSTAMAEDLDPEDVMEIMDGVFDYLIEPIYRHEGIVARLMGDAILAFFGAPISHENDPERACRAALEILAGVNDYATRLEAERGIGGFGVRVGINTGLVVVGEVGSDLRMEYTAMGDAINLAARMEQNAPVGGILITHDTYRQVRGLFDVHALEPLAVKGKREPVHAYLVERAKPRAFRLDTRGVAGVETRMIGREAELKRLQDALYLAIEDHERQAVTIVGEAGLGKSRLLYEFEAWLDLQPERLRFFRGRAGQEMQAQPYALLRDLFALNFGIQDSDPPALMRQKFEAGILDSGFLISDFGLAVGFTQARAGEPEAQLERAHVLGQLLGFDFGDSPHLRGVLGDAQQLHDRALIYLTEFFVAATKQVPVVVFLEDIHWADDSSLDAVNRLVLALAGRPLLIVCLTRPVLFERRPHWGEGQTFHTRLELRPLSRRDSRHLVGEILQKVENVPDVLREQVIESAEGNPLYVEELLKMLIEDGVIARSEEGPWQVRPARLSEIRVPPTLTAVLQARLDSLPLEERTILQQASVVGRQFWDDAVERLCGSLDGELDEADIGEILSALRDKEMVFQRETSAFATAREYTFKHAVLQEVTYENVLKRVRRLYHKLVAEWLIERSGERLGEFTGLIAEHLELAGETEQAVAYLARAGQQAASQFANAEAVDYFSRALGLLDHARLDPDRAREQRYALLLGREAIHGLLGKREAQKQDLEALQGLADERGRAEAALRYAAYHDAVSQFAAALEAADEAVRCAEQSGDRGEKTKGLIAGARALWRQGRFEEARTRLGEALALARQEGDRASEADSLHNLGAVLYFLGEAQDARDHWEQARKIRHNLGDRRQEATSLGNLVAVYSGLGDLAQGKVCSEQALEIHQIIGDRRGEATALSNLAGIYHALGDLAAAREHYERSRLLCQTIGDRQSESLAASNLGLVLHDLGDDEAAHHHCEQALAIKRAIGDRRGEGYALNHLALALEGLEKWDAAAAILNEALRLRRELGQAACTVDDLAGLARCALARGWVNQALAHTEEVLAFIAEHGAHGIEYPLRAYLTAADVLVAADRPQRAGEILHTAEAWVQEQGQHISDEAARQLFVERVLLHQQLRERLVRLAAA